MKTKCWLRTIAGVLFFFVLFSCSSRQDKKAGSSTQTIDLYANTKGDQQGFLGINVPFGSILLGPQTQGTYKGIGYHYNDSIITGLIVSTAPENQSSLEINPENAIRFFPTAKNERNASFLHKFEVVKPGYYSVYMHNADVAIEMTATKHVGYQRYFFPPSDSVQVVINKELTVVNDSVMTGKTASDYFMVQFSRAAKSAPVVAPQETILLFDATHEEMLYIKVAISSKSIHEAALFIEKELPGWDFEQAIIEAGNSWNRYLSEE